MKTRQVHLCNLRNVINHGEQAGPVLRVSPSRDPQQQVLNRGNNIEIIIWDYMACSWNSWDIPVCAIVYMLHFIKVWENLLSTSRREKLKHLDTSLYRQLRALLSSQRIAVFYDIITHSIFPFSSRPHFSK